MNNSKFLSLYPLPSQLIFQPNLNLLMNIAPVRVCVCVWSVCVRPMTRKLHNDWETITIKVRKAKLFQIWRPRHAWKQQLIMGLWPPGLSQRS